MKKIIFIGAIGLGSPATNGETFKNQLLVEALNKHIDGIKIIDTDNWRHRPWVLLNLLLALLFNPNAYFIISACNGSVQQTLSIIKTLRLHRHLYYWVIGGSIAQQIKSGERPLEPFKQVELFLVEGDSMRETFKEVGLTNTITVPNFKPVKYIPIKSKRTSNFTKFVFLSRILPAKGCDLIIDAVKRLQSQGINDFSVTFFGPIDSAYKPFFESKIENLTNVEYKGFLDLKKNVGYDTLSKFDVMLFPTYWDGEGFPGIIIDAYIASMPIIASDWNMNKDVIDNGKSGWLIPVNDSSTLADKMLFAINNVASISEMSDYCKHKALSYDIDYVITKKLLKDINLL